jgi:hemerythrin-like domain-containing protein
LAQAHQELRRQINQLKAGLGQHRPDDDVLVTHCLAFCAALTAHHQGEDSGMFAELLRERPDLAGTVANLVQDHEMIGSILSRVAELAAQADRSHGPALAAIGREFDGLAAIMESHFNYEERSISAALDDAMPDPGWSDMVFRFRDGVP